MAFPNDGRAISMHGDSNSGDIDHQEGPAVLAGKGAFGFDRFPIPAIKPKDPIGFCDRIPALNIIEFTAMRFTRADVAMISLRRSACTCFAEKPITVSSRSGLALDRTEQRLRFPRPV